MNQVIAIERSNTRRNYTLTGKPSPEILDTLIRVGYAYDKRAQQWWKQEPDSGVLDESELALRLAAEEASLATAKLTREQHQYRYQSYYTPVHIAAELAELAGIKTGMSCLEPSAGRGAIAERMAEYGGKVTCIEADPVAFNDLTLDYEAFSGDFLLTDTQAIGTFDRIVMNPPFSRDQDARHVCHAWEFLKTGGKLVAIVGSYALNGRTEARQRLAELMQRHGRVVRELPPGTFENNARAAIIELVKP